MENTRELKYSEAIREAIDICMQRDTSVFVIGEGVPDPKGIFGTTVGLIDKYGDSRVLDMPLSENALTGVCIGAALNGMRPIMTHQRMDFTLLSMDEIINNSAKWHYMFGGCSSVPLVIRMIIGRGWGQGAQHSQNLQALFAHIPGLKVVMPTSAYDAKGLLISSVEDNNPVIFIEHRWLHNITGYVPENMFRVPIGKAKIVNEGTDITIASNSYMTIESIKAANLLKQIGVNVEVVDLRTIKPLDKDLIIKSVKKTRRLLVVDSGWKSYGVAAEIIAGVIEENFYDVKCAPQRICLPDLPTPTSSGLTKYYYPNHRNIIKKVLLMLERGEKEVNDLLSIEQENEIPLDVPDLTFTGPF